MFQIVLLALHLNIQQCNGGKFSLFETSDDFYLVESSYDENKSLEQEHGSDYNDHGEYQEHGSDYNDFSYEEEDGSESNELRKYVDMEAYGQEHGSEYDDLEEYQNMEAEFQDGNNQDSGIPSVSVILPNPTVQSLRLGFESNNHDPADLDATERFKQRTHVRDPSSNLDPLSQELVPMGNPKRTSKFKKVEHMIHEMPPLPLPPNDNSSEDVYYTPSPITKLRTKPSTSIPFTRPATEDWTQDYREAREENECVCSPMETRNRCDDVQGNCLRNDILDIEDGFVGKGAWCYTTGWDSKCSDLLRSKYPDNPVSYEACKNREKPIEGYYCIYDGKTAVRGEKYQTDAAETDEDGNDDHKDLVNKDHSQEGNEPLTAEGSLDREVSMSKFEKMVHTDRGNVLRAKDGPEDTSTPSLFEKIIHKMTGSRFHPKYWNPRTKEIHLKPHPQADCSCTDKITRSKTGEIEGSCRSSHAGKGKWCYTVVKSGCRDLTVSESHPNFPRSYQACRNMKNKWF